MPDDSEDGRDEQDFADEDLVLADEDQDLADEDPVLAGEEAGPAGPQPDGPWDAQDEFPPDERIDFGSLQVPVSEGFEIQLNLAEEQGTLITVLRGGSSLQLQAFAAPKSGGLWEDVRREIAAAVAEAGGASEEADGRFGAELRARVAAEAGPGSRPGALQPIRFLGVDGPRGHRGGPRGSSRTTEGPARDPAARAGEAGHGGADGRGGRGPVHPQSVRTRPGDHRDPLITS